MCVITMCFDDLQADILSSRGCLQEQFLGELGRYNEHQEAYHCGRQRICCMCSSFPNFCPLTLHQLGGGCELAMMCDIILASPTAKFGQPEINLGVIPGGGATQRLTHAIGKSRAMEIILTGRNFSAVEAEKWGLVSKVVDEGEGVVVTEALQMAKGIASKGQISVLAAKETVNAGELEHLPYAICSGTYSF